jgi:hypothetical protein
MNKKIVDLFSHKTVMQFQDKDEIKQRKKDKDEIKKREKYFLLQAVLRFFTCGKMISIPKCCVDKCRAVKLEKSYNQAGDSKMMFTWYELPHSPNSITYIRFR